MGYRSSVYFALPDSYWQGLMAIGKKLGSGSTAVVETVGDWVDDDWIVEPEDLDTWKYSKQTPVPMHFGEIHDIKWYRDPGGVVAAFESYLQHIPEELWGMIIIGEEPEDNEFWGMPFEFDMYLERHVNMPGQKNAPKIEVPEPEPIIDPNLPVPINWLRSLLKK